MMLLGWRRFGPDMPKTTSPLAYFNGKFGRLNHTRKFGWSLSLHVNGETICIPAYHYLDILFMDDSRGKKRE